MIFPAAFWVCFMSTFLCIIQMRVTHIVLLVFSNCLFFECLILRKTVLLFLICSFVWLIALRICLSFVFCFVFIYLSDYSRVFCFDFCVSKICPMFVCLFCSFVQRLRTACCLFVFAYLRTVSFDLVASNAGLWCICFVL